jgi:hypothetical protein
MTMAKTRYKISPLNVIFAYENIKKQPSKVAHNSQPTVFFHYWHGYLKGPF